MMFVLGLCQLIVFRFDVVLSAKLLRFVVGNRSGYFEAVAESE